MRQILAPVFTYKLALYSSLPFSISLAYLSLLYMHGYTSVLELQSFTYGSFSLTVYFFGGGNFRELSFSVERYEDYRRVFRF